MSVLTVDPDLLQRMAFKDDGLLPAVAQDAATGDILMLAYMNPQSLERTLRTGLATFWSRSRQALWTKGETSGHTLTVREIWVDCDQDALVLRVTPAGPACHTLENSCFYRRLGWTKPRRNTTP